MTGQSSLKDQMASALTWQPEWEHGASFHGNWPACVEAEQVLERFTGGQPCPQGCGSIIRYRVGRPREESVARHIEDPQACRRHRKSRRARRSVRAARGAATASKVPTPEVRQ